MKNRKKVILAFFAGVVDPSAFTGRHGLLVLSTVHGAAIVPSLRSYGSDDENWMLHGADF